MSERNEFRVVNMWETMERHDTDIADFLDMLNAWNALTGQEQMDIIRNVYIDSDGIPANLEHVGLERAFQDVLETQRVHTLMLGALLTDQYGYRDAPLSGKPEDFDPMNPKLISPELIEQFMKC